MLSTELPDDAFEVVFKKAQNHFNTSTRRENTDRIKYNYEKGLNKEVFAVVAVMLLRGDAGISISQLSSTRLDKIMADLDYANFDPYIKYLVEKPSESDTSKVTIRKVPTDKKLVMINKYKAMFVRYIYKMRALEAERD